MDKYPFEAAKEAKAMTGRKVTRSKGEAAQALDAGPRLKLRPLAQVVIGVGALVLVLYKSDARGLVEAFKTTRLSLMPLALLATVAVQWLMAYRWAVILGVKFPQVRTHRLFVYYLIAAFFSNFVPGGAVTADVTRLVYAGRETGDRPFILSTLVYERVVGMFTLLMFGLGAMLASRTYRPSDGWFYVGEAVLGLGFLASAALMSDYVASRLIRLCRRLGARLGLDRIGEAAARTLEAISWLRRYKLIFVATVALSVLVRLVWSLGCYAVAVAMGLDLGLPVVFAFISLVDLIRLLPISVGGIGVRELTLIALFANVGLSQERAVAFSILAFAPLVVVAIAGGIIYIMRASLIRADEPVSIESAEA
ncbi:MAG TPA: lysylphosphatidylglycerol synthase transmembrane domain-containing protein [Blastocatellia bacterium]|nr:lysylphosphatidylglycerol synthase transmembrane domain-containing protein [Blastocatellia bacterium]